VAAGGCVTDLAANAPVVLAPDQPSVQDTLELSRACGTGCLSPLPWIAELVRCSALLPIIASSLAPWGHQADMTIPMRLFATAVTRFPLPVMRALPCVNPHYSQCILTRVRKGYNFYQLQLELFLLLSP
jgi:hypothetical protein